ncbi:MULTISPECIES: hypothetical protein [Bacillus]|uniref:hypothetical protein n=1 Tax=Bacillus TaxID=1386 RepID=UPI0011A136AF|nr:hypothetical protein [Bacillus subtilis]MBT2169684.1 hypothetical protein [Bacillus subtilis]MDQ1879458.1 hypothetical protein [Bacillus subtilis]UZJ48625.1 hypothetical protein OOZ27_01165 [Bacillus subtilis]
MEWGKVFDLLKTILTSWPLAAVVIVFAIRKSLKSVIENRLFTFKVGNVEIIFDKLLEKVDQSLEEASQRSEEEKVESESVRESENTQTEKQYDLPEIQQSIVRESQYYSDALAKRPRLLVKESWREVERKIRSLAIESGGDDFRIKHPKNSIIYLTKEYPQLGKALKSLLELRNFLLNENYELKSVDATIFRSRCLSAIDELNKYMEKSNVAN